MNIYPDYSVADVSSDKCNFYFQSDTIRDREFCRISVFGIEGDVNYDSIMCQGSNLVGIFTLGLGTAATRKRCSCSRWSSSISFSD